MNPLQLPWLEISILVSLLGALSVSRLRDPTRAYRWGLAFTGSVFACTLLAWLGFYLQVSPEAGPLWSLQQQLFGRRVLGIDELNAPLVPAVALLHFLTALATARTKMRRFSFSWSLTAEAIRLATFSCTDPWVLIGLLAACTVPPYVELVNRGRPTRVYVLHMALFVGLMVVGWYSLESIGDFLAPTTWGTVPLLVAILIRCGVVPAHCWLTDWFEHASFGNALLFVTPLPGVYAVIRLVLPVAPDWVLESIGLISLVTAVYAAGMAIVQREVRRFFAYLFLSHASLVLVGLELHTAISLTGALCLWFSVIISLGGFGLTLRALESRFGRLSLIDHHGLYEHSPTLAVCFLLTGLASVGFPGTLGFVSTDLLVDGAIVANPYVGLAIITTAALNGIAIVRAYLLLFTGARHTSTVSLEIGLRERIAVLTLAALILGGGLFPQPGVSSRQRSADRILEDRMGRFSESGPSSSTEPTAEKAINSPFETLSNHLVTAHGLVAMKLLWPRHRSCGLPQWRWPAGRRSGSRRSLCRVQHTYPQGVGPARSAQLGEHRRRPVGPCPEQPQRLPRSGCPNGQTAQTMKGRQPAAPARTTLAGAAGWCCRHCPPLLLGRRGWFRTRFWHRLTGPRR